MIDILFGDSAAGALKIAQAHRKGEKLRGATATIGGKKADPRWQGETFEKTEVLPLTLALDIGDVSAVGGLAARKTVLERLYGDFPEVPETLWAQNEKTLGRLREAGQAGEPIRLWAGRSDPAELCGLYYVCRTLLDSASPLSVVFPPDTVETGESVTRYSGTCELPPELFGSLLRFEQPITLNLKRLYASMWGDLVVENAGLRAVVNGRVVSVRDDFYDFALYRYLTTEPIVCARVIGSALVLVPGVGDRWLYLRLKAFEARGDIIEVTPPAPDHPYSAVIKKV